jgi:tRNA (mo5U34)-methyltransferase
VNYFSSFLNSLENTPLASCKSQLPVLLEKGLDTQRYGDLPAWQKILEQLPKLEEVKCSFGDTVTISSDCHAGTNDQIENLLRQLIPWRKGPFAINEVFIDTEWRSDWKWQRLLPHIESLQNRLVLDVGCGNGYHCWRMLEAGAKRVIGIDPSPRFVMQFYAIKHFAGQYPVDVLPIALENIPEFLPVFDTVFSMGVLYHRPSPMDHLRQLKSLLRANGQLVLETLVIADDSNTEFGQVLVPEKRYAMMNNVWFIPTPTTLCAWLKKCGFENSRVVNVTVTNTEEQRVSDWMQYHSLADFLDPNDPSRTIEGYPAPRRAIILAEA